MPISRPTHPHITRAQTFFQFILPLASAFFFYRLGRPFSPSLGTVCLLSAFFHFLLFAFFPRLFPSFRLAFQMMSIFNTVLLGAAVHFSGGIVSPFVFVFIAIIIAEASYDINYPVATLVTLATYLVVIVGEAAGWWPPLAVSPSAVYANRVLTVVVVFVRMSYMAVAGSTYKIITGDLRDGIAREQEERERMQRRLAQLQAPSQIGVLVQKIVHDTRGPLGAVSGFIEILRRENELTPASQEDCRIMLNEISRVSGLFSRLLHYVKPGGGEREPLALAELLEAVLTVISFHPDMRRVKVVRELAAADRVKIYAAKDELQQVYFNLLKNAMEAVFSVPSPQIAIRASVGDRDVEISISDNGPGIPADLLSRLGDHPVSSKKDGAGVGLVIVKEILRAHDGNVQIRSDGGGTEMVTRLPLYSAPAAMKTIEGRTS